MTQIKWLLKLLTNLLVKEIVNSQSFRRPARKGWLISKSRLGLFNVGNQFFKSISAVGMNFHFQKPWLTEFRMLNMNTPRKRRK